MKTISIDIETFSSVDLKKSGVYKYAESPDFEILLFAYSIDGGQVEIVDLMNLDNDIPNDIKNVLLFPETRGQYVVKQAYNAQFERVCLGAHFGYTLSPELWECTQVHAAYLGFPFGLDLVASIMKLSAQKDAAGKALINYFCKPCKPTKANGFRTRNLPEHAPEKWAAFKEYCKQDVRTEQAVKARLSGCPLPAKEQKIYCLDQKINDKGVKLDRVLIEAAMSIDRQNSTENTERAKELTGLENPNSVSQLKQWFFDNSEVEIKSLSKGVVSALVSQLKGLTHADNIGVLEVLELRQEMSKSSIKKYAAMQAYMCDDERARGLLQYYGANRTGRWAGRGIQIQNLARIVIKDIATARGLIRRGDYELAGMLYANISFILSQLIRTAFIALPGNRLIVSDFSAIEARVIAWLAGENWRLEVFKTHGKIYEASAAQMFKIPIDKVDKATRQRGKVAELALGYQGGKNALIAMGALDMGLTEGELPAIVKAWRRANPAIVQLWYTIGNKAIEAVKQPGFYFKYTFDSGRAAVRFIVEKNILFIELPSGRRLSYLQPSIREGRYGDVITYWGLNDVKQWARLETYSGKLVENIVQAIARDILAEKMLLLDSKGYSIVMHVHDEVVCDVPKYFGNAETVNDIMKEPLSWAPGLPLNAETYESEFYKKD
jgi:DNA polymerase bacteriophage-type